LCVSAALVRDACRSGRQMTGNATLGGAAAAPLKTLADKVNWVLDAAHTAGRGRLSDAQVVFKIYEVSGEKISTTTIWKLRNGQLTNPQLRVIQALARTYGVQGGFFLEDYDEAELGLQREQVELLALIRDSGFTAAEVRTLLGLDDEDRTVIAGLFRRAIGPAGPAPGSDPGGTPQDR
jgi:transcriptional regulator with XRE-family HTH domain